MRSHVQRTVASCFAVLRKLRSIRRSVPSSVFQTLVVAIVLSRLDYGNASLVGLLCKLINRLQSVLNAAARRLLDCDDHTTSLTLLPVFTGCEHLSASSLNWQSLSTELFTALHLGICLICYIVFLALHQDAVSGRSSTCSKLVIPLSRLVTAGDRSLLLPAPGSGTLCPRTLHLRRLYWCSDENWILICFGNIIRILYCSL